MAPSAFNEAEDRFMREVALKKAGAQDAIKALNRQLTPTEAESLRRRGFTVDPADVSDGKVSLNVPGAKADGDKIRLDLVVFDFTDALTEVGKVATYGAKKYTDGGWKVVPDGFRRYVGAGLRHLFKHIGGEVTDPESGQLHLAHFAWNGIALLQLFLNSMKEKQEAPNAE
jgi:hypothetical protein